MRYLLPFILACTVQAQFLINPFRFAATSSTLNTDLACYWDLDEASGTRADSEPTGTARNLTDVNTVTSTTGKIGNAGDFEADNSERLTVADNADLSGGDTHFTIRIWGNLESTGADRYLVAKGSSIGSNREYALRYNNTLSRWQFVVYPDGTDGSAVAVTANSAGAPSTGTFYCIHCGHDPDANVIWISVDGGTRDTTSHTTGVHDGTSEFEIGARQGASFFDGALDEAAFWRKTLTTGEVTEDVNGGSGKTYPF